MNPDRETEIPLRGGTANRGSVVRVGDTVRKPLRPTSPATHALLEHLERVGFEGAPRFLGVDAKEREVLSYVDGEAATAPYPDWALTDQALDSVAHLLRRYHEAVESFDPAGRVWPQPAPARYRERLISHNDPNLDNVVFRDGLAVALIDFDLAGPGSRVWDVAAAARLWVPLRAAEDITDARSGRSRIRLRAFVDAYGLDPGDRHTAVDAVLDNHDWSYDIVRRGADAGQGGYSDSWTLGADRAERTRLWYLRNAQALHAALD